jgi:hypothetical protein
MSTENQTTRRGRMMMVVGLVFLVAAAGWLLMAAEPFPMWLLIAGGGLMFIGVGAAANRTGG